MTGWSAWTVLLAVSLLTAGCSSTASEAAGEDKPPQFTQQDRGTGAIQGRVQDPELMPLAGASVFLQGVEDSSLQVQLSTGESGGFGATGLAPGRYIVSVSLAGYVSPPLRKVTVTANATTQVVLEMAPVPTAAAHHESVQLRVKILLHVCVLANQWLCVPPMYGGGQALTSYHSRHTIDERAAGRLEAVIAEAMWEPSLAVCQGGVHTRIEGIATLPDGKTKKLEFTNSPNLTTPTHVYVARSGEGPKVMDKIAGATEYNVTGLWKTHMGPGSVARHNNFADVDCLLDTDIEVWTTYFHIQDAPSRDWSIRSEKGP
jgi:hypothetical protein